MLPKSKADELTKIAVEQLTEGLNVKMTRMESIREYWDLYNNKTMDVDADIFNIPFPYFANFIDKFLSKIDNSPTVDFKIPNKKVLSQKIQAAWEQEQSSSRAGWNRKDRVEKKQALISGRAISKIYASSVDGNYKSHYDIVDVYSFIADPTRGQLMDGNYHGETDIFKTRENLVEGAKSGIYDKGQVSLLKDRKDSLKDGSMEVIKGKFDRLKALGVDVEKSSFVGQKGILMAEWIMRNGNEWFYLLFDPMSGTWVRAEPLKEVFENNKTPFCSWATHYDEYAFWSKALSDDVAPVTEAMRFLLNNAIENEKRRTRPMRLVDSGSLLDINELQDYIPDNVIVRQPTKDPHIVTVETPEVTGTINLINFLDTSSQSKTGVQDTAIQESNAKVGIFYGQLQQEADRIGTINKEYSESYAQKGYNFFWGLKQHLSTAKQVEMLGKSGFKMQQLEKVELSDVDDVDDVIVSGGSSVDEMNAVNTDRRLKAIKELTAAYPTALNPHWVIRTTLRGVDYEEDDISEALDVQGSINRELMEEADQAIQEIILGGQPILNQGADISYMQRIKDFVTDEINYIKLDKSGKEIGIDAKKKELADKLLAFMKAHQDIVIQNNARILREEAFKQQTGIEPNGQTPPAKQSINVPPMSQMQGKQGLTMPFENGMATPTDTASASQLISQSMRR